MAEVTQIKQPPAKTLWPYDLIFIGFALLAAWLAAAGIVPLSGSGAVMDSDLETYAQGMTGARWPDFFKNDPVLENVSPANSIPNLQRMLGEKLAPEGNFAIGLLMAGGIAIFLFYAGWYIFGRWLFGRPSLAALLSLLCGVTVWVGWGTFWGILHSDPVPRVFFAALMPYALLLAFISYGACWVRPIVMLVCGLGMWAHGISALNFGAMIFMSYIFIAPPDTTLKSRILNLGLCLAAFFTPVCAFLWPSLHQGKNFSQAELATFQDLFNLRWQEDYSNFASRVMEFISPKNSAFPILICGAIAWIALLVKHSRKELLLVKAAPCYVAALICVACFCWAETRYAPEFGRLPMGHELVRGLRFLVPLAWLLITAVFGLYANKWVARIVLMAVIVLLLIFQQDRQFMAMQFAITQKTGITLPLSGKAGQNASTAMRQYEDFKQIEKIVPENETIYAPVDAMQTRYLARRPLVHSFKDGYVFFYNKDEKKSRQWLELEKLARQNPQNVSEVWKKSGAQWLLLPIGLQAEFQAPDKCESIKLNHWMLYRRPDNF